MFVAEPVVRTYKGEVCAFIASVNAPLTGRYALNLSYRFTGGDISVGNDSDKPDGRDPGGFEGAGATAGDGGDARLIDNRGAGSSV